MLPAPSNFHHTFYTVAHPTPLAFPVYMKILESLNFQNLLKIYPVIADRVVYKVIHFGISKQMHHIIWLNDYSSPNIFFVMQLMPPIPHLSRS